MRRIQRDATKEELIQQLCDSKIGYFNEIWRLLLFSAMLGKAKGKREPLRDIDSGKSIDPRVFGTSPLWPGVIHLLAISESRSQEPLREENWNNSLQAFEEFANGGLSLISIQGMDFLSFIQTHFSINQILEREMQQDVTSIRI